MSLATKGLLGLAGAAAMVALVPQAAEAGTVVAASGPSASRYPVGSQIGNTQRVSLRQGDALTVLDNGGTRVLRGPGTFILARQSGQNRNTAFTALTTRRSATRARTGAVRNTQSGEAVTNPNLWYVDVEKSGTICLSDPTAVRLWRADTAAESIYSVVPAGAPASSVRVSFAEKEMLARWDAALQISEGENYTIDTGSGAQSTKVNFVFLDAVPEDPEALARTLIANGCTVQLEQMSAALAEG